jgi:hypothetical protein
MEEGNNVQKPIKTHWVNPKYKHLPFCVPVMCITSEFYERIPMSFRKVRKRNDLTTGRSLRLSDDNVWLFQNRYIYDGCENRTWVEAVECSKDKRLAVTIDVVYHLN